ncbi:MAG: hypothetical protein HZB46_07245 [Solirubrobacterales bacterium]|nr:hypothetical protein [Solirubrobacterales bacterium]
MADRMMFIGWGAPIAGREERGMEVFDAAVGFYGRCQQEGRIEAFDVRLLQPHGGGLQGYFELHGSAEQLATLREDMEFRRIMIDASLIVAELGVVDGMADAAVAEEMGMYREAIAKVPQATT